MFFAVNNIYIYIYAPVNSHLFVATKVLAVQVKLCTFEHTTAARGCFYIFSTFVFFLKVVRSIVV